MRIRIIQTPNEDELDGVRLDLLTPGSVRDVSVSVATWLIAQGYAQAEMRAIDEDIFNNPDHHSGRPRVR